jgi:dephospho-CoA kinase
MSFVVGLTGGIGSGKSAAAAEFERLGADVVDTDAIAHELTGRAGRALPEIERVFGAALIGDNGALDRTKMRSLVFADPAAKKALEALLHPMIREESQRRIAASRGPYLVHVVPLLIESADYRSRSRVDRVLVIDAPEELQLERARARSGLSEADVRAIIAAQAARAERLAAADDVIENRGTIDALRQQVAAFHRRYLEYSKAAR